MIYIIADDLTGATDTGVQFSKQGYNTHLVIVSETGQWAVPAREDIDVLVIDTETREIDAPAARTRIRQVLGKLQVAADDVLYKKVDSTLRGNIGVELDECLRNLQVDLCIFTSSFPQNARITVGGYLIVDDQPLGLSEYYQGDLAPEDASFVPTLLQHDVQYAIAQIELRDVIRGRQAIAEKIRSTAHTAEKILVADAINEGQLHELLVSSFDVDRAMLYSGSAGLANALSDLYHGVKHAPNAALRSQDAAGEPVLVVSGSRRTIVQRQIEYLKQTIDVVEVNLDVERLVTQREEMVARYADTAIQGFRQGQHVVLHPDPAYHHEQSIQTLLSRHGLRFRELELAIREFLGVLVANILDTHFVKNIILTGGDTAIGVCSCLQITHLNIIEELLPGIPLCVAKFHETRELNIVTKAGGFGEQKTFHTLITTLTPSRHREEIYESIT
ncbi:hypothetical protein GF339_01110 [candidate division KSB3 bacterium]|uniref:Serine kinase n=1 Tax=candidate division KSB3 bacterium TaxID=2044937 RepID=A0A9D5JSE0_9BACT|nr:hypothetical protein [candidate division KSB3 bacterium]